MSAEPVVTALRVTGQVRVTERGQKPERGTVVRSPLKAPVSRLGTRGSGQCFVPELGWGRAARGAECWLPTAPGAAGHAGCGDRTRWCWDRAAPWLQHLQLPSCPSCTGAVGLHEGITPSAQTSLRLQVVASFPSRCCRGSGSPRASRHRVLGGSGSQHHTGARVVSVPPGVPVGALGVPSVSLPPQGCSGRWCTVWRGWRAWWRSGSVTH